MVNISAKCFVINLINNNYLVPTWVAVHRNLLRQLPEILKGILTLSISSLHGHSKFYTRLSVQNTFYNILRFYSNILPRPPGRYFTLHTSSAHFTWYTNSWKLGMELKSTQSYCSNSQSVSLNHSVGVNHKQEYKWLKFIW